MIAGDAARAFKNSCRSHDYAYDLLRFAKTLTIALRPANSTIATKTLRYSYSGGSDSTSLTMTSTNVTLDRTVSLPGGVICSGLSASTATWAYPNIHGDITYTINHTGAASGPYLYDPYGQTLTSAPNTSPGDFDNGWLGQHQRPTEQQPELKTTIEMGARPYRPDLGRFLRLDPIVGGVTYSDYSYVVDPVNSFDLSGNCPICVPVVPVAAPAISAGAVALFGGIVVAGVAIGNFISSIDITAPWSGGIDLTEFLEKIEAMRQEAAALEVATAVGLALFASEHTKNKRKSLTVPVEGLLRREKCDQVQGGL